jgi:DNA-binding CsgD family transcriptional regulator
MARVEMGDFIGAREALCDGLPVAVDLGDCYVIPIGLAGLAGLAAKTGWPRQALRLAGAASAYTDANEFAMPQPVVGVLDRWLAPVQEALGARAAAVFDEGRQLPLDEAVAQAIAEQPNDGPQRHDRRTLTRREIEVAALVARGLTNRKIAEQLFVSARTIDVHVDHILTKLGFHSRTQLAAWAYETSLLAEDT